MSKLTDTVITLVTAVSALQAAPTGGTQPPFDPTPLNDAIAALTQRVTDMENVTPTAPPTT